MSNFYKMYQEFERTNDVSQFYDKYSDNKESTRFLLIRSLDKKDLQYLYELQTDSKWNNPKGSEQYRVVYDTAISIEEIVEYIESQRTILIKARTEETEGLESLLKSFGHVSCGVGNDKIDDIVKTLVRDKSIKSKDDLEKRIEGKILPRLHNYILWSFYNQIANDLIELFFIKNIKIIPTMRKIHDIDFFVKIDDDIIPFDLKITHISDDFFELFTKGLYPNENGVDDFEVGNEISELECIKQFYKDNKKKLKLPNYGGLGKEDLLNILLATKDDSAIQLVNDISNRREEIIKKLSNHLRELEWWNYKYQGERLFCNNNRLFIFLAYENSFEDGRPLKGHLEDIGKAIDVLLGDETNDFFHTIKYNYQKQQDLNGPYQTKVMSILITSRKTLD